MYLGVHFHVHICTYQSSYNVLKAHIWARILGDRNTFCILRAGRTKAGSNAPGAFLVNRLFPGN